MNATLDNTRRMDVASCGDDGFTFLQWPIKPPVMNGVQNIAGDEIVAVGEIGECPSRWREERIGSPEPAGVFYPL